MKNSSAGIWACFLAAAIGLSLCCWKSARDYPFHLDEVYTDLVVSQPTPMEVCSVVRKGALHMPPFYFLLGWGWKATFGSSLLAYRALPALIAFASLVALFAFLRTFMGVWHALVGSLCVSFASQLFLKEAHDARPYSLLLLEVNLSCLLSSLAARSGRFSWTLAVPTIATHAALVTTHYFGILFSGSIFAASWCSQLTRRKLGLSIVLPIALGWLGFVPWLPAARDQLGMLKNFWTPSPRLYQLGDVYNFGTDHLTGLYCIALYALSVICRRLVTDPAEGYSSYTADQTEERVSWNAGWLTLSLLAIPVAAWIRSKLQTPVFLDRYFIGVLAAGAVLVGGLTSRLLPSLDSSSCPGHWRAKGLVTIFVLINITAGCFMDLRSLDANIAVNLILSSPLKQSSEPVIVESGRGFLEMWHHFGRPGNYIYLSHSAEDVDEADAAGVPNAVNYLSLNALNYVTDLFPRQILSKEEVLARYDSFTLVHYPGVLWLRSLKDDKRFVLELVRAEENGLSVWHVQKRGSKP